MKPMSVEEYAVLAKGGRSESFAYKAIKLIREFVESGYEVAELEPADFGLQQFTKTQPNYLRDVIKQQALALKLEQIVCCETHSGKLMLVRIDI